MNIGNYAETPQEKSTLDLKEINAPIKKSAKLRLGLIIGIVLVTTLVGGILWMALLSKELSETAIRPVETTTNTQEKINPQLAVFMREGVIYKKDFTNSQETRVSKSEKVNSPDISPNGKYVIYFEENYNYGGFPRNEVFVSDIDGNYEKSLGRTNKTASKITWSSEGEYLGAILFSDGTPTTSDFYAEILLYDAQEQKEIVKVRSIFPENADYDKVEFDFNCASLENKYFSFCKEYATIAINKPTTVETRYKFDTYKNAHYTREDYILHKASRIKDDLVTLEYYKGKPTNPESSWRIAGGIFIPGYSEGTTETYTLLINEKTGKVIAEIENAISTKFLLKTEEVIKQETELTQKEEYSPFEFATDISDPAWTNTKWWVPGNFEESTIPNTQYQIEYPINWIFQNNIDKNKSCFTIEITDPEKKAKMGINGICIGWGSSEDKTTLPKEYIVVKTSQTSREGKPYFKYLVRGKQQDGVYKYIQGENPSDNVTNAYFTNAIVIMANPEVTNTHTFFLPISAGISFAGGLEMEPTYLQIADKVVASLKITEVNYNR